MGSVIIKCYLGFPTHDPSDLARDLERTAGHVSTTFHDARRLLHRGLDALHEATDRALEGGAAEARARREASLEAFRSVGEDLERIHGNLLDIRHALETASPRDGDPFLRRDRRLIALDRGAVARALAARGLNAGADPAFHEVVDALLAGGSVAATRLVERQLLRMQTELRTFVAVTRSIPLRPLREFAERNHARGLDSLALCLPWSRFETLCAYLNYVCERATELELAAEAASPPQSEIA